MPGTHEPAAAASTLSSRVGTVSAGSERFASNLLQRLPSTFRNLLYTRAGAVQLCYGLVIYELTAAEQTERLALIPEHSVLGAQPELLGKLLPSLIELGERARFPMLELAMPALRKLDPEERDTLLANVQKLVQADNRVTLFELALTTFLWRHLGRGSGQVVPVKYRNFRQVKPAIEQVLSLFARAGTEAPEKAQALYQEAISGFGNGNDETMHSKITMQNLRAALSVLNQLSPLLKPAIIDACGHCISHDGKVEVKEYELMRLVADQLDCPMPPL